MELNHEFAFVVDLPMSPMAAVAFVRDVPRSLSHAAFVSDLQVFAGDPAEVAASLPVNAALFGQHDVPFRSQLWPTADGARLAGLKIETEGPGWAEVHGEVRVVAAEGAARADYRFHIAVHLELPKAERWGGRALLSMIRFTAQTVLEDLASRFPEAIRAAADDGVAVA